MNSPTTQTSKDSQDLSSPRHRQFIGVAGALLPVLVLALDRIRETDGLTGADLRSVSAYYYTGAVVVFVGTLIALSIFLFMYEGYRNEWRRQDRVTALIAGTAAALVALFPTSPPKPGFRLSWWTVPQGYLHYAAAALLLACFAYYCLVLFRKPAPGGPALTRAQNARNFLYAGCGITILASMVWAAIAGALKQSIFFPEALALEAFALSWLVKGRVNRTAVATVRAVRHPVQSVKGVWKAMAEQ